MTDLNWNSNPIKRQSAGKGLVRFEIYPKIMSCTSKVRCGADLMSLLAVTSSCFGPIAVGNRSAKSLCCRVLGNY